MAAPEFDRIVYFGDSLSDGGTIYDVTAQLLFIPFPLDGAGYDGVFSNGPVHTQIAPDLLGVEVANYAAGGARAIGEQPIGDLLARNGADQLINPAGDLSLLDFDINLGGQVARFVADEAANPYEGAQAASILIGLNDLSGFVPTTADPVAEGTALLQGIVGATLGAAQAAVQAGADQVILYTFPDVSFFPFADFLDPALLPLGQLLIEAHRDAINLGATGLEAAGIATTMVDLGQITGEIVADMSTFGFLDVENSFYIGAATNPDITVGPGGIELTFPENPAVAGLDADQFAFFDLLHPTSALHGIVAAYQAEVLTSETHFLDDGADVLRAGREDDFVLAKGGDDVLRLGRGDDVAFGGTGDDRAWGQGGDDILALGSGDDFGHGGGGNDVLAGGDGNDCLFGGASADLLIGGRGSDKAFGGAGADVFLWTDPALTGGADGSCDIIFGGSGHDTLYLAVADHQRAAVEAELDHAGFLQRFFGYWNFETLGLKAVGVEEVVLVDSRADLASVDVPGALEGLLHEADLWGLV